MEKLYGLSFSPCGNFLASTSQDSIARVWYAKDNCLTNTMKVKGTNNDCLRLAWAGVVWVGKGGWGGGVVEGGSMTEAAGMKMMIMTTVVAKEGVIISWCSREHTGWSSFGCAVKKD